MRDAHCSLEDLSALAAGERAGDPEGILQRHLETCTLCSRRYAQMRRIDQALRKLPIPAVDSTFTAMVLKKVARTARMPLAFRLLEHGASVFGVLLVVAAFLSAYLVTEGLSAGHQSDGPVGQVVRVCGELMSLAAGWVAQHSRSVLGEGSGVLLMLSVVAVGVILLMDRWLSARMGDR